MINRDPPQGLLDYLSRRDELQIKTNQILEQILVKAGGAIPAVDLIALQSKIQNMQLIPYQVISIPMDVAGVDVPYTPKIGISNSLVATCTAGTLSGCTVKMGNANNDPILLSQVQARKIPIGTLYVSWPALIGQTLRLYIGATDLAEFDLLPQVGLLGGAAPLVIFNAGWAAMPAGTYYSTFVNLQGGKRLLLFFTNTLSQPITVQAVGQIRNIALPGAVSRIALPLPVIALTGVDSIGISDVYWHPYIAVEIIVAVNPAAGNLLIEAVVQG